jgi:flagellar hook assembly protein FlgD
MLPLSTTLTGTAVPSTNCKPKKNPKTTPTINIITTADLKYSFLRILVKTLKVLPSTVNP